MKTLIRVSILFVSALLSSSFAQVLISEVDPATGQVELHNTGSEAVDVTSMFFCNRPAYIPLSALDVVSGETTIEPDGYLVLTWDAIATDDAELGLYSSPNYNSADAIASYVAWGSAGHGREGVAVEAGIWTAGAFLDMPAEGQTLSHVDMMGMNSENWAAGEPSLGAANAMQ